MSPPFLSVTVDADSVADDLPEEHENCIYRVVQESGRIHLSVLDDGQGFDSTHTRGLGLLGMEERVTHLGGRFHFQSEPGHGARLRIEIPLAARAMEAIA